MTADLGVPPQRSASAPGCVAPRAPGRTTVCFRTGRAADPDGATARIHLRTAHAEALSELMPVLICGEESASLVFGRYAAAALPGAARDALSRIADDENIHENLLQAVRRGLPPPLWEAQSVAGIRRFFRATADREPGRHFSRIAALDSGLCEVLARIRDRRGPISRDPAVSATLARIHRDEARHVLVSTAFVRALLAPRERREQMVQMRRRFARLLELRADSFEALAVDPDKMLARLREPPAALLA